MSAAVAITPATCLQPDLLGMPTPPRAPLAQAATEAALAAGQPLRICVMGRLRHDAAVRELPGGGVCLEAWISQRIEHHPAAVPLFVRRHMPDMGSTATTLDATRRLARRMPAGTTVIAVGAGLEHGHRAGEPVFRLLRCDSIAPETEVVASIRASSAPATTTTTTTGVAACP